MTKETLRQRKEWRRCSGELPEGGWLVINGVGKVMRETDDGLREPYNGDASGLIDAGARIRIARIAAGLTQEDLAKRVGLTQGTLWEWESGRRNPTRESLDKVFDVLTPHDGPASSDASADGAADADTHSDVATSRPMPRTKANLRRLRDATETSQASLAIAAGLDINNPASVKDVRHWEDSKNRRWAPEPVWLMLEDTLTDQRATARETAKAIVEQQPDRTIPVTLHYYRNQNQYEADGFSGGYGVYNAMASMVGDLLEDAGYMVEFRYPDERL